MAHLSRVTHAGAYTHAGPEIGVASTKAFTAQGDSTHTDRSTDCSSPWNNYRLTLSSVDERTEAVPAKVEKSVEDQRSDHETWQKFKDARNFFIWDAIWISVALEGALKLKEISYIHAEGYPAAEMKHGPIALIDAEMPVVVIAKKTRPHEKVVSNIQEVKQEKESSLPLFTEGDTLS